MSGRVSLRTIGHALLFDRAAQAFDSIPIESTEAWHPLVTQRSRRPVVALVKQERPEMAQVTLGSTLRISFGTGNSAGAVNADSLPVVTVLKQGVALAYAPVVTNIATGLYEVAIVCSTANVFEIGKEYSVYATATVSAITGRDGIGTFNVLTNDDDSLRTAMLSPTVPGRTLDVSVGGEAGLDWANIGSPTAAAGLSGTTVKTATDVATDVTTLIGRLTAIRAGYLDNLSSGVVSTAAALVIAQADLDDIQTRLPAALSGGYMASQVKGLDVNTLTSTALDASAVAEIWGYIIEGGYSAEQLVRGFASALLAKASGFNTATRTFRDVADTKNRIVAAVDASGRTTVTLVLT